MLTTVAKRIQSRLSRAGVKVSLGDVKTQCEQLINDINNPTETELLAVQEYFMNNATILTVVNEAATEPETLTNNNSEELKTTPETSICAGGELGNISPIITEQPETLPQSSQLATTTKSELVSGTAQNMGIVLDASEISLIAENINDSTDTLEQDIDAIKAAIMAFVEHKAMVSQQKINNMITEVREVVSEKNNENSQLLTDGLRSINNDIQEANKQFKSNVKKALTAFNIPSIKAG